MASVQELIALAEHESRVKNPVASSLQNVLAGVQQSNPFGMDTTIKLMQMDQMRQQQEQQRQMQEEIKAQLDAQNEGAINQGFKSVSGPKSAVLPSQKLQVEISQDESGRYSRKFKTGETAPKVTYQKAEYLGPDGKVRVGRFNPQSGEIEQRPTDPFAPKSAAEVGAENGKMLPANTVLALNEGKNVARLLPEVSAAIKKNEGKFGPVTGSVRTSNPYDEAAKTFDSQMRTASQSFGKFMEGGVLRKEDEEKYRKMFPQANDIDAVKKNKLSIISKMLSEKYNDDRKTLGASGYDVSGFEDLPVPKSIFDDKKAPEARFDELVSAGKSEDEAYQIMAKEGY